MLKFPFTRSMIFAYTIIKSSFHAPHGQKPVFQTAFPLGSHSLNTRLSEHAFSDSYELRNVFYISTVLHFSEVKFHNISFISFIALRKISPLYWEHTVRHCAVCFICITSFNKKCTLLSSFTDEETNSREVIWCSQDNIISTWMIWS